MVRLRVREVAEQKGITDPVMLAAHAKIAYATAYRLWQGDMGSDKRGVGFLVLYRVARSLGVPLVAMYEETEEGQLTAAPAW